MNRARGEPVEVLAVHQDAIFIKFQEGPCRGVTGWILSDELEQPLEALASVVCQCERDDNVDKSATIDTELGMYVCGSCGKPSALALEKAAAREGLIW